MDSTKTHAVARKYKGVSLQELSYMKYTLKKSKFLKKLVVEAVSRCFFKTGKPDFPTAKKDLVGREGDTPCTYVRDFFENHIFNNP